MKTVVKSKNPCPFCGKKEWIIFGIEYFGEEGGYFSYLANAIPIIDCYGFTPDEDYYFVDECVFCGALIQG